MKKVITHYSRLAVLAALTLFAVPTLKAAVNVITHTVEYDNSGLAIGTDTLGGVTYTTVVYGELENGGEAGSPSLPIDCIHFSVPFNAVDITVSITNHNIFYTDLDYLVYPRQTSRGTNGTTNTICYPDSTVYFADTMYPTNQAQIIGDDFISGTNRIVTVLVMPIAYCHTKNINRLAQTQTLTVCLTYNTAETLKCSPLITRDKSKRAEGREMARKLVVNPDDVEANSAMQNEMFISSDATRLWAVDSTSESVPSNRYPDFDYIIITPDTLKSSVKRLAALKKQKGYSVGIITVEEVINTKANYPWYNNLDTAKYNDSARIVREFLSYAYCIGRAKYVLMAGKDVPFKYGWFKSTPTDQYFADLTSDWASGSMFTLPELFVGRVIAKSEDQMNHYTDKLLRYELNPGRGDYSYLTRAFYTNGYDQVVNGDSFANIIRQRADSIFTAATVMQEDRNNGTPTGQDIIAEINNTHYGLISFNNHGLPMGIVTYGRGGSYPKPYKWLWALDEFHVPEFITSHTNDDLSSGNGLDNLANKYYPSIGFSTACYVMPFDIPNEYDDSMVNFGESFTTGKDYGGPAFIGNTRDNGHEAALLQRKVFRVLKQEYSKVGKALAFSKAGAADIHGIQLQNLLGDPEFDMWTATPQVYSNVCIERTDQSITITGINSAPTLVAYCDNDGQCITDTVSAPSHTLSGISPNGMIMLYMHNHIPYIAPLHLQNVSICNSQYVMANDVVAGYNIENSRTAGEVIVSNGTEYEIEASGVVKIEGGFRVETGAKFAVYPSCF